MPTPQQLAQGLTNPYAGGLQIAGAGAGGGSANWGVTFDPASGSLVANTGFGEAPIYNAQQFSQWQANPSSNPFPTLTQIQQSPTQMITHNPGTTPSAGWGYSIKDPSGGTQSISYKLDPATGYYIPTSAVGHAADTGSFIDNLIKYGAIAGTAAVGAMGAANAVAPGTFATSAGPGASALGGSAADIGSGAGGLGATVPSEISNFAPTPVDTSGITDVSSVLGNNPVNIAGGGGLASGFAGGQYLDPLASGPQAGVPGSTGTFSQGAPISSGANGLEYTGAAPAYDVAPTLPSSAFSSSALSTADKLKLAQQLLKLGQTFTTQPQVGRNQVGAGGGIAQGAAGLMGNMKMMLEANAQAKMNGQPLPFPGLGNMGT